MCTWAKLVETFSKQYKYNIDLAPNSTQIHSVSHKESE